jgi:hypothetical protein
LTGQGHPPRSLVVVDDAKRDRLVKVYTGRSFR